MEGRRSKRKLQDKDANTKRRRRKIVGTTKTEFYTKKREWEKYFIEV